MFTKIPSFNIGDSGKWIISSDLKYFSKLLGVTLTVPAGFPTDLATIPRILRPFFVVNGKHRLAAVVHDYLYSVSGAISKDKTLSRKESDKVFYEAMKLLNVGFTTRRLMYRGVRLGGWLRFKRDDNANP